MVRATEQPDRLLRLRTRLGPYTPVAVLACLGLILSLIVAIGVDDRQSRMTRSEFDDLAENAVSGLRASVQSNLRLLELLAGFYAASREVERDEFRQFLAHALPRYRGFQAVEWLPRVPDAERDAVEAAARREGFPDFQITERSAEGRPVRAARREEYFPVYFVEPNAGNEVALGFNIASEPVRREALERARDTGLMAATGRIRLMQETGSQWGVLVFVPIYRNGSVTATVEDRRANLAGFGLAVFRVGDLVESALARPTVDNLRLCVQDNSAGPDACILCNRTGSREEADAGCPRQEDLPPRLGLHHAAAIDVAGRQWEVTCVPTAAWLQKNWLQWSWICLAAGLALTGLVAAYLGSRIARQHQVECLAADMRRANERLQDLATRDELTGLWNRRQFMECLNLEVERVGRHRAPLALAMMDVDRFKTLNDTYGHAFGDRVLAEIGRLLRAEARSSDITARYAGDEFVVLMPHTPSKEAFGAIERLREALVRRPVTCGEQEVAVTLSAGLSAADPVTGTDAEELLQQADVALYRAKRAGRNCVWTYDPVSRGDQTPPLINREAVKAVREQVASLCRDSQEVFLRSTESLAEVLASRNPHLKHRAENVQRLAVVVARAMGLDADQVAAIRWAAAVHDIGMVGIPAGVLLRPGPLAEDERRAMEHHVLMGIHILNPMRFLERELPIVHHHHEHWNGQGYPDGLERDAIPVGARVLAVADALEAMTSGRPYRAARRLAEALQVLQDEAGRQFDPGVVEPLVRWVRDLGQADGGEAGLTVEDLVKQATPVHV